MTPPRLVAGRSRGTPRIANRLLKRVRDYAQVRGGEDDTVTEASAADALALLEIDERGLDAMDRQLLRAIAEHHGGGPVGLATMAATVSEPIETIEDVVEPYLMQIGLLARTPRGRHAHARRLGAPRPDATGGAPRHRSRRSPASSTGSPMSPELGRIILVIGLVLVVIGGLAVLGVRLPFGRLPGDIAIEGENGGIYIPLGSMIVISLILTLILNFFVRR